MKQKIEMVLNIILVLLSFIAFIYVVIAMTITQGVYRYYEVELNISEYGYAYAIVVDGEGYWEKEVEDSVYIILIWNSIDTEEVNIYKIEDKTFNTLKLLHRNMPIYRIDDKYYFKKIILF